MDEKQATELFAAYFKPTGVGTATRYGVGIIGQIFDSKGRPSGVDTDVVCPITYGEMLRAKTAYDRQVREGALVRVTVQEYLAYLDRDQKRNEQAAQPAETKKAAKAAKE